MHVAHEHRPAIKVVKKKLGGWVGGYVITIMDLEMSQVDHWNYITIMLQDVLPGCLLV